MEGQGFGWSCTNVDDGWRKGPWTPQEDKLLVQHVNLQGEGRWNSVSRLTGLKRCGKSCRLRWVNYLRPDLKRGKITPNEETIILELHARWGNRWSTIARSLPGRTDNEIKNYWRTHFKKGKTTKSSVERGRARFIRQQQEQKQCNQIEQQYQLQQDHHQLQQQLLQPQFQDTEPMKRMVPQVEADATTTATTTTTIEHENMQDYFSYMFPMSYNNMFQDSSIVIDNINNGGHEYSMSEDSSVEEVAWGSLWNLDADDRVFSF